MGQWHADGKRISVVTRDEIINEIATINATDFDGDWNTHLKSVFTELNLNVTRMHNGSYNRWYHGE